MRIPSTILAIVTTLALSTVALPAVETPVVGMDSGESIDFEHAKFDVVASTTDEVSFDYFTRNESGDDVWLGNLKCETSWASPTFLEIDGAVHNIRNFGGFKGCIQKNGGASKCTRLTYHKGGDISLCGEYDHHIDCEGVIFAARTIRNKCGRPDMHRAGGLFRFKDYMGGLRLAVH